MGSDSWQREREAMGELIGHSYFYKLLLAWSCWVLQVNKKLYDCTLVL